MYKPDSLRQALTRAVPEFERNPHRLHVFIDRGRLIATAAHNLTFEYAYSLNLVIKDFGGNPDDLMLPIVIWIARHQPQLLAKSVRGGECFTFEVDPLNNKAVDISITLPLSEKVTVEIGADGTPSTNHPIEPIYDPPFAGVDDQTLLWQLFLRDDLVAKGSFPEGKPPTP